MNNSQPFDTDPFDIDNARFDRLVDGELSAHEYRALLASLDDEPGGWRRCALAFVESQALGQELGKVRDESVGIPMPASNQLTPPSVNRWRIALAMAACFLVAFGLGAALQRPWSENQDSGNPLAEESPEGVHQRGGIQHGQDSQLAGNHQGRPEDALQSAEPITYEPLRNVTLVVGDDEVNAERFELPVVQYGDVGDEYFNIQHSAMSAQMREMLQRSGHRLERQQRFVPLEMGDGQHVIVPIEEVEIVPVRWPAL